MATLKPQKKPRTTLTRKQAAFVEYVIDNPKSPIADAAAAVYNTNDRHVARAIAAENLTKPIIQSELAKHSKTIEDIITNKTYQLTSSDQLDELKEGLLNARWMHDKIHGKATQKLETQSTSVNMVIDLRPESAE